MPETRNIEIRAHELSELVSLMADSSTEEEREEISRRVKAAYNEVLAESGLDRWFRGYPASPPKLENPRTEENSGCKKS